MEEIFGQAASLGRSQEWGIPDGCSGVEGVETLWCGGDPVWGSEDVENPALGFLPLSQPAPGCGFLRNRFMRGKTRREGRAANGVPTQIFAFIYKQDLLRRAQSPGNDPKHALALVKARFPGTRWIFVCADKGGLWSRR